MADSIDVTARTLLACVCTRLEEDERPTCGCFATVGPPVVALCCECEKQTPGAEFTPTGEATINFVRMYDADPQTLQQVPRIHPCKRSVVVADFSIVLTRCYPMVNSDGEMPDADDQDAAATLMHADIQSVFAALTCSCNDYHLIVGEVAVDSMPEAGCAVLAVRLSVEVAA